MKTYIRLLWAAALSASCITAGQAQTNHSAYFLSDFDYRHELNPAFDGKRNYISFPALSNLGFYAGSSVGVSHFLFPTADGQLTTFMNESVGRNEFLDALPKNIGVNLSLQETLLASGFHAWNGFNTVSLGLKSQNFIHLPKGLFSFMKSPSNSEYLLEDFGASSTNYLELALGHSRQIDERLRVGAKAKILVGLAKMSMIIDELSITTQDERWAVTPKGAHLKFAAKGLTVPTKGETGNYQDNDYELDENGQHTGPLKPGTDEQISYEDIDFDAGSLGPTGWGMAFDLGAVYRLNDDWTFSAALLDLGFLTWKNATEASMKNTFEFDGFREISVTDDNKGNKLNHQVDQLVDDLSDLAKFSKDGDNGRIGQGLAATLNLGAEYTLPVYDRLRFGFLSSTHIQKSNSWTEARFSANYTPVSIFEMAVNYAVSKFGSSGGVLLNLCTPYAGFFVGFDAPFTKFEPAYHIPVKRFGMQLNVGINIHFGKKNEG